MSHVYIHGHKIVNHTVTFYVTTYWNGPSNIIYLYLVSLFDPSGAENELSLYLTLKVEWKLDCCIIIYTNYLWVVSNWNCDLQYTIANKSSYVI